MTEKFLINGPPLLTFFYAHMKTFVLYMRIISFIFIIIIIIFIIIIIIIIIIITLWYHFLLDVFCYTLFII